MGSVRLLGGSFGSSPVSGLGGEAKAKDTVLRKSRMVEMGRRGTAGAQLSEIPRPRPKAGEMVLPRPRPRSVAKEASRDGYRHGCHRPHQPVT